MKKKEKEKNKILTLSPKIIENEVNKKYINKLEKLLLLEDCKNIAIVGNYGSGKSSFIKTFFYKRSDYKKKALTIAIGSYIVDDDIPTNPDKKINSKEQILVNRVEESILKQIIYRKKFSKFPKSSLIRYDKEPKHKEIIYAVVILYSLWFCIYFNYKYFNEDTLNFKKLYNFFGINGFIMFLIIVVLIYRIAKLLINKIKVNKIKIKDCELELHQDSNSLFSRYLSEIIYYFQVTKCNLVVFEDLDRFPNDIALKVIQELKELNTILNNGYGVNKVVFIYAVKDNLFDSVEDKNKFYDYNLSVLPISTTFNSELNLIGLLKDQNAYAGLSSKVIGIISKYIYDMRTLINIVNDYCLFKDITNTKNNDKLFAMVAFKNHFYKEYNLMFKEQDIIKEAIQSSEIKRKELIKDLGEEKNIIVEEINRIKSDILNNCKELKELLLAQNIYEQDNSNYMVDYFRFNSSELINISNFLSDDFDMRQLEENTFEFRRTNGSIIPESNVFESFGSKEEFIERYNSLHNNNKILELEKLKEEIEMKMTNVKLLGINEIFRQYFTKNDLKTTGNNQLLYDLIKNNYITEDYMDYITAPVIFGNDDDSESLMYSDSEYLMNFRQQKYSFNTKLTGFKTILNIIKDDLDSPYILNYDLLHYLISNNLNQYLDKLFIQFKKINDIKLKFLLTFLKMYPNYWEFVLGKLSLNEYDIWSAYIQNGNDFSIEDGKFLLINMLYQPDYIKCIKDLDSLKNFFIDKFMLESDNKINEIIDNENVKQSLLIIHPRIKKIGILNQQNYDFIYKNNLYSFNKDNIYRIIQKDKIDFNTLKSESSMILLYNYIKDNLNIFCDEYYIKSEDRFDTLDLINKVIFDKNINVSVKKVVYKKEKFKLRNIENIEKELYESLILYDHLNITWKNIIDLYKNVDNDLLFKYVTDNINKLISKTLPSDNLQKINLFFRNYVLYLIKIDLIMAESIIHLNTPKYEYEQIKKFEKEQLILLVKYDCLMVNKSVYKFVCKILSKEERFDYILNCFKSVKTVTEILNIISFDDLETLLTSDKINNNQKIELLYGMYKKEKRVNAVSAFDSFVQRLKLTFKSNAAYEITNNKTIYNSVLRKVKQQGIFKLINITEDKIKFKI